MDIQETPNSGKVGGQEPIPGYRLIERIGRGGYGEVWKTLAPGGVPKAIKLIYGDDSARMSTELRAINRVKDVRHPFLLSIERIEQNGDLLAIVTELGDKNLQQYFQEFIARQQPGIPQAELLSMLRDVADVLDYIYQEHALQHLDIKPGNLLVFGKRLKVADFGLVKNIFERSASLVHGLTPTYAAPEIFEGQPTRSTDQYSLAILYQEMLTGILPFNGMTAARLATQHLRESPNVSPLPSAQRSVIARALSKDPHRRFSNCMELIEALVDASRQPAAATVATCQEPPTKREPVVKQPITRPASAPLSTPTHSKKAGDTAHGSPAPSQDCKSVPTILIGIGGSAGKALQGLRLRIGDRLGGMNSLRAIKTLLFDIDQDALNEVSHDQQAWRDLEAVSTPLRSSAEYREQGQTHRRWMSRRWLFNVPRSLQTDGLRPFGRLALLCNANRVLGALRSAIHHVTAASPGVLPRILFVSSISGGTGSGMLPDLAYATRHELRNAGFQDIAIDAVLLHSTPVGTGRDKAILNAVATLSELQHYSAPTSFYPGEPLLQIPPIHGDNKTFASMQLLHLGNDLEGPMYLRAVDNVAEHLYCRLLTNLDQTMSNAGSHAPKATQTVDLVQIHQIGGDAGPFVSDLARQLCVDVIKNWCGLEAESRKEAGRSTSTATEVLNALQSRQSSRHQQLAAHAEKQAIACGIDVDPLLARAREMLHQEIAVLPQDFLTAQIAEAVKAHDESVPDHELASLVIAMQDRAVGLDFGERPANNPRNTLFDVMNPRLTSQAMPVAARFVEWVCNLIDEPMFGVDAARRAAEAGRNCIRDLIGALGKEIQARQARLTNKRIQLTTPAPETVSNNSRGWSQRRANQRANLIQELTELGLCSFDELLDVLVHSQLRAIEANVSIIIDELMTMYQELEQLASRIENEVASANSDSGNSTDYELLLQKQLVQQRPQLIQELRSQLEQHVFTGPKKLQRYVRQRCSYDHELGDPLRDHARRVVLKNINQLLCVAVRKNSQDQDNLNLKFDTVLAGILQQPWTLAGGKDERAAVVVPENAGETSIQTWMTLGLPQLSVLPARTNNVSVCRERRESTIREVIQSITDGQIKLVEVAANLHTRTDVEWTLPTFSDPSTMDIGESPDGWADVTQTVQLN